MASAAAPGCSGELTQGDFVAKVLPSKVRVEHQVLELRPVVLEVFDGRVTMNGRADFNDPENARFRLAANARGLTWGGPTDAEPDATSVGADADFGFAGTLQAWAAIGRAELVRDGERAKVEFDGRGNDARMTLRTLKATMPSGTLDGRGVVTWKPALGWSIDATLAGFDPGYFAPDWRGAVDGKLSSQGSTRSDGGLELSVDARALGGRLRNRPLKGRGRFAMHGAGSGGGDTGYEGNVALSLGGSQIDAKGKVARTLDVDAKFTPLVLSDLLPGGAGSLRGTLRLSGPRTAPDVTADLVGSGLKYGDYQATSLTAKGRLPWQRGSGAIAVRRQRPAGRPAAVVADAGCARRGGVGATAGRSARRHWRADAVGQCRQARQCMAGRAGIAAAGSGQRRLLATAGGGAFPLGRTQRHVEQHLPRLQRRRIAVRQRRLAATRPGRAWPVAAVVVAGALLARSRGQASVAAARRDRAGRPRAAGRQCLAADSSRCVRPAVA